MKKLIGSIIAIAVLSTTVVQASESFGGFGISVYPGKKGASIASVLPNSPAEQAGLQAGDVLVSVNGTLLSSVAPENQISMLRGKAGSSVNLLVNRNGENISLTVKRADISVQNLESREISDWFGTSKNLSVEELNYLASLKTKEGYKLLGVMQNGFLVSSGMENLGRQQMHQISLKKEVAGENIGTYVPSVPKAGGLNSANREAISFSLAEAGSVKISVLNVKGVTVWQKSLGKMPADASNVEWNGASLPAGFYHVKLETGSAVSVHRVELR